MATVEALTDALAPIVAPLGLELYDVELTGSGRARVVRVSVHRTDGQGIDLDALADATHAVEHDVEAAVTGAFQLEVSSPGLERKLSRSEHFRSAIGSEITVKYRDESGAATRARGRLTDAAEGGHTITIVDEQGSELVIAREAIVTARTVFEWGPAPRPGRGTSNHTRFREASRS